MTTPKFAVTDTQGDEIKEVITVDLQVDRVSCMQFLELRMVILIELSNSANGACSYVLQMKL